MPDRLVYSTDGGRVNTCPVCGQPYKHCRCDQLPTQQVSSTKKSDGIVRIMRDRKHRGGKTVRLKIGAHARNGDSRALAVQREHELGCRERLTDGGHRYEMHNSATIKGKLRR